MLTFGAMNVFAEAPGVPPQAGGECAWARSELEDHLSMQRENFAGFPGQAEQMTGQQQMLGGAHPSSSEWSEHEAPSGRKYYFNRRTRESSWEVRHGIHMSSLQEVQ